MQISHKQNQATFGAKVPSIEKIIDKGLKNDPKIAAGLRAQAAKMEKIGPDATTTHQIFPAHKKSRYTLVTTVSDGQGFSATRQKVKLSQLASTAESAYKKHLKKSAAAHAGATSGTNYFQNA